MKVIIFEYQEGLLFKDGILQRVLAPGKHRLFGFGLKVDIFDKSESVLWDESVEVMTKDGGTLKTVWRLTGCISDTKLYYQSGGRAMDAKPKYNPYWNTPLTVDNPSSSIQAVARAFVFTWISAKNLEEAMVGREELVKELAEYVEPHFPELGLSFTQLLLTDFWVSGSTRAAYADLLKAELEGKAALARARNEAATMRSLVNTAKLTQEHPGLMELRILTSGQKPRVSFVVGAPDKYTIPES